MIAKMKAKTFCKQVHACSSCSSLAVGSGGHVSDISVQVPIFEDKNITAVVVWQYLTVLHRSQMLRSCATSPMSCQASKRPMP